MGGNKTSFKEYLEKYSASRKITPEEASEHKIVQLVKSYYEENDI